MPLRDAVRALILDPDNHVLLVKFDGAGLEPPGGFWAHPGGGVEMGETRLAAMKRELREEVGLEIDELGPEVWTKTAHFPFKHWDGQIDHIHLFRTDHFEPAPRMSPEELAAENVHDIRWWSPEEIAQETDTFAPRAMAQLLGRLRREGVPPTPIVIDGF